MTTTPTILRRTALAALLCTGLLGAAPALFFAGAPFAGGGAGLTLVVLEEGTHRPHMLLRRELLLSLPGHDHLRIDAGLHIGLDDQYARILEGLRARADADRDRILAYHRIVEPRRGKPAEYRRRHL